MSERPLLLVCIWQLFVIGTYSRDGIFLMIIVAVWQLLPTNFGILLVSEQPLFRVCIWQLFSIQNLCRQSASLTFMGAVRQFLFISIGVFLMSGRCVPLIINVWQGFFASGNIVLGHDILLMFLVDTRQLLVASSKALLKTPILRCITDVW